METEKQTVKKNRLDKEAQENIIYKPVTNNAWTNTDAKHR